MVAKPAKLAQPAQPDKAAKTAKSDHAHAHAHAGVASGAAMAAKMGRLLAGSTPRSLIVDFDGNARGPLAARSVVTIGESAVAEAVATRQSVVLLFENGDASLPIVVGLVPAEPGAALLGALLAPAPPPASATLTPTAAPAPSGSVEARVDGRRVVVEGQDEVVLKCGEASITLKRDGKLILRGAYVETHAKGVNRIKGGSVKIN